MEERKKTKFVTVEISEVAHEALKSLAERERRTMIQQGGMIMEASLLGKKAVVK